jgi:hypothetical protein
MCLSSQDGINKLKFLEPLLPQASGSISSLNEAWLHLFDGCQRHSPNTTASQNFYVIELVHQF